MNTIVIIIIYKMSSNLNIVKGKDLNVEECVGYKPAVVNKRGGKNASITYNRQALRIKMPLMLCWGVNERVDEQSGRVSYDLAIQFNSSVSSQRRFLENLKELQNNIKETAVKKSKEWFGKSKMSMDVVDALMYPILKYPNKKDGSGEPDYDRDPTVKIKLPFWENKFSVEVYDMDKKPIYLPPKNDMDVPENTPVELIPKGAHINGIIQCNGLWFAGGKFGVTWKLLQCCVRPPARLVGMGTCHIEDDSDDEEALEFLNKRDKENENNNDDDDDEEEEHVEESHQEEEEEEEEDVAEVVKQEVEKAKPKKKKVVRRKKKASE